MVIISPPGSAGFHSAHFYNPAAQGVGPSGFWFFFQNTVVQRIFVLEVLNICSVFFCVFIMQQNTTRFDFILGIKKIQTCHSVK